MMSKAFAAAAFGLAAVVSVSATAQVTTAEVYLGMTGAEIGALVVEAGYTANVGTTTDDNTPWVEIEMAGFTVDIYTYACDREEVGKGPAARCESVQMMLTLSDVLEPELIEGWNREFRYVKAWTSSESGAVRLSFDFLVDGITADQFIRNLGIFDSLIEEFVTYVG